MALTQKHLGICKAKFADHRLEIIPAVAVQNNELVNALAIQHFHNITQHSKLCTWIHVDVEFYIELTCVDAERNARQYRYLGTGLPGDARGFGSDGLSFKDICSVGKVIVVCFGGAPWQDGDFIRCLFICAPMVFSNDVWSHVLY